MTGARDCERQQSQRDPPRQLSFISVPANSSRLASAQVRRRSSLQEVADPLAHGRVHLVATLGLDTMHVGPAPAAVRRGLAEAFMPMSLLWSGREASTRTDRPECPISPACTLVGAGRWFQTVAGWWPLRQRQARGLLGSASVRSDNRRPIAARPIAIGSMQHLAHCLRQRLRRDRLLEEHSAGVR